MRKQWAIPLTLIIVVNLAAETKKSESAGTVYLWRAPEKIAARDLFYGAGGKEHAPAAGIYTFVEEDRNGTTPKFVAQDSNGVKWKVKLGAEARPETSATRLVWAMGYNTDEDYFVPEMRVLKMPAKRWKGRKYVTPDGIVRDARWERMDHKKVGLWHWKSNPFYKTRELDGLRVLMSMLNNFDLKDSQNSIYDTSEGRIYLVSDLGATFGRTGSHWPAPSIRGDVKWYGQSDFIQKATKNHVDFAAPSWPLLGGFFPVPPFPYTVMAAPVSIATRKWVPNITYQRWIGKGVPLEHVQWIAGMLAQLTPKQIRDMFRAAHYTPEDVEAFSQVVERRIAQLQEI
jgi:hypothetical protein